uniref:HTH_10 domain-containing protein n=1 Tax=Haemonchus contortus TaxID=6289 RepID=A0A7I4YDU2_HAECO
MYRRHSLVLLHDFGRNAESPNQATGNIPYSLTALVKDAPKSGRLMKLDLEVLLSNMEEDPYLTAREVATMLGYNQSTVVRGPEQLGKLAKLGRWVPHELPAYDLSRRVASCISLLTFYTKLHFLKSTTTGDEKWVLYYSPMRK